MDISERSRKGVEGVALLVFLWFGAGVGGGLTLSSILLLLPALVGLGGAIYAFG